MSTPSRPVIVPPPGAPGIVAPLEASVMASVTCTNENCPNYGQARQFPYRRANLGQGIYGFSPVLCQCGTELMPIVASS